MSESKAFEELDFPKFLHGQGLKTALTMFPYYAEKELKIIVPYLIQSEILDSILNLPDHINIKVFTRNKRGYLPSIRQGAQPALDKLKQKKNLKLYIDNRIHAKIWLIDNKFTLVHSMNGTPTSETVNFEAGIMSIKKEVVDEVAQYFQLVESQAERIK